MKVGAWGAVHMFQSGQEIPGAQCDDKDDDTRRIDKEECVVKDSRHARRSNVKHRFGCNSRGSTKPWDVLHDEGGDDMKGDGEK